MLQQLRDQTQSTGFKILVVAIIFVLTLFGFGATNIFMGSLPSIATVGDFDVTEGVLSVETERERHRLLSQMGPEFDPADIDRIQLQNYALDQLVNRRVYQAAAQLDIEFSDAEVNRRPVEILRIRLPVNSARRFIVNSCSLWVLLPCSLFRKFSRTWF